MKRAQTQHVFAYLVAVIVILAVIWIGMTLISTLMRTGCEAQLERLRSDLVSDLDQGQTYGSRIEKDYNAPCDASGICFVDARDLGNDAFTADDGVLASRVRAGEEQNIYLITEDGLEAAGYVKHLWLGEEAPGDPLCIEMRDALALTIIGRGRYVTIQAVS